MQRSKTLHIEKEPGRQRLTSKTAAKMANNGKKQHAAQKKGQQ